MGQVTKIKLLGWLSIFVAYGANQVGGKEGTPQTSTIYFMCIAIGFLLLAFAEVNGDAKWIFRSIAECCFWNVIDELSGTACILSKWEYIGAIVIFAVNFLYEYKVSIYKYYQLVKQYRK